MLIRAEQIAGETSRAQDRKKKGEKKEKKTNTENKYLKKILVRHRPISDKEKRNWSRNRFILMKDDGLIKRKQSTFLEGAFVW